MTVEPFENNIPIIASSAFIAKSAVIIGNVSIGEHSSVWPMTVIRGDVNEIRIGNYSNIQDGSVLHVAHQSKFQSGFGLYIGNEVTAGHKVILHACRIGNRCLIGMGSTIMDGAIIADNTIIGANSLVAPGKKLDSGLWVGSPAKKIRDLTAEELEFLPYSAKHYAALKDRY